MELQHISAPTTEFTLQLLKHITNNFSEENIIGHGASAIVYKGVLDNGEEIAMKKLHQMPGLDERQFVNEYNNLSRAKHKNIIRLIGYCYYLGHERVEHNGAYIFPRVEERLLCYEYMQGGNLDKHISDQSCGLDWHTRYKIIEGVCEGLNFLHNGTVDPIFHLDLKPANILLGKDMVPKIGDFGLSRLFPSTQTHITKKIIGTLGYMPPEFIESGRITPKFDIFSLGVIIIKIIAGPDGYSQFADMSSREFRKQVHENWEKRLRAKMPWQMSREIETCLDITSRCLARDERKRPCIRDIISELNNITTNGQVLGRDIGFNKLISTVTFTFWVNGPIIVGAGPAGLVVAACLHTRGVPTVMLEREDCIASLWQKRTYDSLKLNSPKQFCELPGLPFPGHYPEYLTRRHFINYLENYALSFHIKPRYNCTVVSAAYDQIAGLWRVRTREAGKEGAEIECIGRWVVAATGANAEKIVPQIPGLDTFQGEVIHSRDYRSGMSYIGKRVLVVGCGQSGMEVSLDLCNYGAVPFMVVRNVARITTLYLTVLLMRWLPLWLVHKIMALLAWLLLGDLTTRLGIRTPPVDPLAIKETVSAVTTCRKIRSGHINIVPCVTRFTQSSAELSDGTLLHIDAVILATGYRTNVAQWMQGTDLFGKDGHPNTTSPSNCCSKADSGLYYVGFNRPAGLSAASADALCIAEDIGQRYYKDDRKRAIPRRSTKTVIF